VLGNDVWKLEVQNNFTWVNMTTVGAIPSPRGGYQLWIVDDIIYLFGGEANYYNPVYSDFYSLDTSTLTWSLIADYDPAGNPGDLRVGNSSTFPGRRTDGATWSDSATKTLWMFAGSTETDNLNDLWCYNISANIWTWISGPQTTELGNMGAIGEASIDYFPRNVWYTQSVVDKNGDVWFHSGQTAASQYVSTNELWRFTPSTYEWAYMGGSLDTPAPVYGTTGEYAPSNWPAATYGGVLIYSGGDIITYYGGERAVNASFNFALNQVWSYNITLGQWAFISGTQEHVEVEPEYGAFHQSSPSNKVGSRLELAVLASISGHMWIHGGSQSSYGNPITAAFVLPVNLCMTEFNPCNANADCAPNGLTVTCACQTGYTGDGTGADGCTMIEVPLAQPQSQPRAITPSGKTNDGVVVLTSAVALSGVFVLLI
jgi:hypothetical protein